MPRRSRTVRPPFTVNNRRAKYEPEHFGEVGTAAVDWLQARQDIDPKRLMAWGSSFGSFWATQMAAAEPDFPAVMKKMDVRRLSAKIDMPCFVMAVGHATFHCHRGLAGRQSGRQAVAVDLQPGGPDRTDAHRALR